MRPAATNCEVLVAGEYYCDLAFSGLDGAPRLGAEVFADGLNVLPGGAYNMVLGLHSLGVKTRWAAAFGTDFFSTFVLQQARLDGLDTGAFSHHDEPVARVSAAFSDRSERGFISYSAPRVAPPEADVAERQRPQWLLQTFRFEPDWLAFIAGMKKHGAKVFADCRSGAFTLETPGVREFLALIDVFSPNESEALAIAGTDDLDRATETLAGLVPVLAMKRGGEGVRLVSRGEPWSLPAPSADVVDTIGAGDAFNAGYLFGRVRGLGEVDCATLAVACGAFSTTRPGGSARLAPAALVDFARRTGLALSPELAAALTARAKEEAPAS